MFGAVGYVGFNGENIGGKYAVIVQGDILVSGDIITWAGPPFA